MRRVLWSFGMGVVGFWFPWSVSYLPGSSVWDIVAGTLWGASIGFGFGTIFEQKRPQEALIGYWAVTVALVGSFFGLLLPHHYSQLIAWSIGFLVGALFGVSFGVMHLSRLRRKSLGA